VAINLLGDDVDKVKFMLIIYSIKNESIYSLVSHE